MNYTKRNFARLAGAAALSAILAGCGKDQSKQYMDFSIYVDTKGFDILDDLSLEYGKLKASKVAKDDTKFVDFLFDRLSEMGKLPLKLSSPTIKQMGLSGSNDLIISTREQLKGLVAATRENKLGVAAHPEVFEEHGCNVILVCGARDSR